MSVAPGGPTVMPGAVGMPLAAVVVDPASSVAPPEEPPLEEPDVAAVPPELLLPVPPLLVVVLPLVEPPPDELAVAPVAPVPVLSVGVGPCGKPLVLGAGELQARKLSANPRLAPSNARFTFGFDVRIMTPPPTLRGLG